MPDIKPEVPAPPIAYGSPELLREVESFLVYDSELLDAWRLEEWLELFTPDARYLVPTTDRPDGDPRDDLFFVRDDYFLLSERVRSITNGTAWAEAPRSTTHRMIGNVRALERDDGVIEVKANLLVHRSSAGVLNTYPGASHPAPGSRRARGLRDRLAKERAGDGATAPSRSTQHLVVVRMAACWPSLTKVGPSVAKANTTCCARRS